MASSGVMPCPFIHSRKSAHSASERALRAFRSLSNCSWLYPYLLDTSPTRWFLIHCLIVTSGIAAALKRTGATYIALVRGYAPGLIRLSGGLVVVSCLVRLRAAYFPGTEVGGHQLPQGIGRRKKGLGGMDRPPHLPLSHRLLFLLCHLELDFMSLRYTSDIPAAYRGGGFLLNNPSGLSINRLSPCAPRF